jgi:hypothetical protein
MAKQLTSSPEARALLAESDTKDVVRYDTHLNACSGEGRGETVLYRCLLRGTR